MRVLICPDKFAGTLSADAAAQAIAAGWREVAPGDELVLRPIADGGPGFLDAMPGEIVEVATTDPLGRPVAGWIRVDGDVSYVESAHACGLHHLAPHERDPRVTSSRGLADLVNACPTETVVIGLGGSGTSDGGEGFLSAYAGGKRLIGASDVDNPLLGPHGATYVFGPQKGATDLEWLEARMRKLAERWEPWVSTAPGGGAAGGLGAAILGEGGRIVSGIDLVRELTGLDEELRRADLIITGEGSFDEQSLRGKAISGLAKAAGDTPLIVFAGRVTVGGYRAYSLVEHFGSVERALAEPERGLRELAAQLAHEMRDHRLAGGGAAQPPTG